MESTALHNHQKGNKEADDFIQQNLKRLKVNLASFTEEKLEIVKAHAVERTKEHEHNWTMHFEKGDSSSWKIMHKFIANDLASLNVLRLSFSECLVNAELVQCILRLIENPQSKITCIEFITDCIVDSRDAEGLEEDVFQYLAISGVQGCKLAFYGKNQHKFNGMAFTFDSGKNIVLRFGVPKWNGQEGGKPDRHRHDLLPPEHTRRLIRMLTEVETLNELDLSEIHLPVDDIHPVCQMIMNRPIYSLSLGLWDVTNPQAKDDQTGGSDSNKSHPGFPIIVDALSSSLFLIKMRLVLKVSNYRRAIRYVRTFSRKIKYPNRLYRIEFAFHGQFIRHTSLTAAKDELNKKLARMQTLQVFVLLDMVYAVSSMKCEYIITSKDGSMVKCPLAMLNVDMIRMLAAFVW